MKSTSSSTIWSRAVVGLHPMSKVRNGVFFVVLGTRALFHSFWTRPMLQSRIRESWFVAVYPFGASFKDISIWLGTKGSLDS